MRLNDPFHLNDWRIRDFFMLVLVTQLVVLCTAGLALFGFEMVIVRQAVGLFYLALVPGTLLLRIFRVHNLSRTETVLYSVGLSIAFVMVFGLCINALYPLVGISNPISSLPLFSSTSVAVLVLCALCYVRDRDFTNASFIDTKDISLSWTLALFLLPFLSVSGAYLMNFHNSNMILLILLFLISIIPILAMFHRFPNKLYPLAIFVIALSLLYHNSLISTYLTGWDIQAEYYYSSLVKANSFWTSSIAFDVNAMLSIVMLAPIFSIVCNLSLVAIFKMIYPIIFSLVPLGLYVVFRKHCDERTAFLSCFFFMSIFTFYDEMPSLARQQIAELFQVLLMLLMLDKTMKITKKAAFGVIFAFSLVTSHYGLSYIFMFSLIVVWGVFLLRKWQQSAKGIVNSNAFVFLYCVLALTWYIYVSSSSTFAQFVKVGDSIVDNISEFANPNSVQGLNMITVTRTPALLYQFNKGLYLLVDFFIAVGIIALFLKRAEIKPEKEYALFSAVNFALLLGGITVPYLSSSLNTQRLFQVTLLFLAPFCVVGSTIVWRTLNRIIKMTWWNRIDFLKVLSIFFTIFILFSSGFVYEVSAFAPSSSISLFGYKVNVRAPSSSISLNNSIDFPRFNEKEVTTAEWLKDSLALNSSIPVYADIYRAVMLNGILGQYHYIEGNETYIKPIPQTIYFFLGSQNIRNEEMVLISRVKSTTVSLRNMTLYNTLLGSDKIYDNDGAQIYVTPGN